MRAQGIVALLIAAALLSLGLVTLGPVLRDWPTLQDRPRRDLARYTERGVRETGAVNQVTAILFDYRGLDTLGEASVILTAALIVGFFSTRSRVTLMGTDLSVIVRYGVRLVLPFLMLFGFLIILFGHVSPGGGFTGGVMLCAMAILHTTVFSAGGYRSRLVLPGTLKTTENAGLLLFIGLGLAGLGFGSRFLANAATGVSLGDPGRMASSGLIPFLNLASGLKVGAGLAMIFISLARE